MTDLSHSASEIPEGTEGIMLSPDLVRLLPGRIASRPASCRDFWTDYPVFYVQKAHSGSENTGQGQKGKVMFLDIFDFDGDGELNAVEMATAYTVMFGKAAWGEADSGQYEDPEEEDLLPDPDDCLSDSELDS